jgi:hypothetical protein
MLSDAPGIYFSVGIGDLRRLLRTPQGVALPFEEWAKQQDSKARSGSPNKSAPSEPQDGRTGAASLQETISWMYSFLEAHGQEWSGGLHPSQSNFMDMLPTGPGWNEELLPASLRSKLSGKESCPVFIKYNFETGVQLHSDMKAPVKTWTEVLFLSDIDPSTIRVVAQSHVHFETRNNMDKVVEIVPTDDKFSAEYDLNLGNFILDSAENAERFANALKHAVNLCGGQSSPF